LLERGHEVTRKPTEWMSLAEADLKLTDLFKALHDFGCGGRILCESPIMEEDALNMKKAWMKVSGEKE